MRLSQAAAFLVLLVSVLLSSEAFGHKLDVDTLSVRLDTRTGQVEGQFLLDPDITRPGGPQTELQGDEKDRESARLLSFVRDHFVFQTPDRLEIALQMRELYVTGGAVPGDSVMFHATLPKGSSVLSVKILEPQTRVAVTATINNAENPAVLLSGPEPLVLYRETNTNHPETTDGTTASAKEDGPHLAQGLEHIATGFVHIVPLGWDHILFVVALTLGSLGRYRRLILELSAFTLAHTITLGLGALRMIVVPASVVEPLIAFSIAAAAAEYLFRTENTGLRFALVGGFGLLHGLGFAGALLDLGFSGGSFLLFLASFNLGVELGQLAVVLLSLAVFLFLARWPKTLESTLRVLAIGIAACGVAVGLLRLVG